MASTRGRAALDAVLNIQITTEIGTRRMAEP
jgi:hypothetical protein